MPPARGVVQIYAIVLLTSMPRSRMWSLCCCLRRVCIRRHSGWRFSQLRGGLACAVDARRGGPTLVVLM